MGMQYRPALVFSVERTYRGKLGNMMVRQQAENDMRRMGIQFERVLGVYQGVEEYSYIVTQTDKFGLVRGIAKEFDQECIMTRDNENMCYLEYFDGRPKFKLGYLKQVTQAEALADDAYTFSPRLNAYFKCVL